ncbi:MAG: hypothetical protein DRO93_08035 [Candidatus Thorarchaeota archaeon]|nr:MAG: hypothetical protein DRO93_08035 [Candidatus Thorarchaeota archaeon]
MFFETGIFSRLVPSKYFVRLLVPLLARSGNPCSIVDQMSFGKNTWPSCDAARVTDSSCNASDKKLQTVGSSADFPAVGILVSEP